MLVSLFVLEHVIGNGGSDFLCFLVLAKIVHKLALRVHQIHDDGVIHLQPRGTMPSRSGWGRGGAYQIVIVIIGRSYAVVDSVSLGNLM